ncbi:hypothetical protein B0T11DRAFT_274503 [Plectosphaerella cucumerina]|uniref:Alcohol acetyltransferase n=1 Tax=Plectosphaerella cucumerina TaxID=40658 RepID=A0A8K0THW9_9PEZI|nr:hypothetical protein B0T11DRAFT_274503 [Plectosphaerella cucumerina]
MIDPARLSWEETSPGLWRRGLDEVEFYWAKVGKLHNSEGRRPFEITGHVSLAIETTAASADEAGERVDTALKNAWLTARHFHPTIASWTTVDHENEAFPFKTYCCFVDPAEKDDWLKQTFFKADGFETGVEFAQSDPIAPKQPTLFIISKPTTGEAGAYIVQRDLVLRAGHDTIDGAGTLLFFGKLLRYASEALEAGPGYVVPPLDGTETKNLSPPYRVAAGIPATPTPEIQRRIDAMSARHVHFGRSAGSGDLPSLPLPFIKGSPVPGKNQRVEIILDRPTVTKLLAACKAINATVTHVLHAAVPLAIRDLVERQPQETKYNYVHDLLYNLRGFCQPPYSTAAHPVTAYHSGSTKGNRVPITVPAAGAAPASPEARRDEFAAVLGSIWGYYTYVKNDADQGQLAPYCWAGHLAGLPPIPKHPPPGPPPGETASVTVSSLGRVDGIIPPRVGNIRASRPWVMGEEMSNSMGLFIVTHDGELSVAAAYNDAWHGRAEAEAFVARCVALVLEFLGLNTEDGK